MLFLEAARSGAHHPDLPGPVCVNPCGISSVTQNWYSDDAFEIPDPRMAKGRRNIIATFAELMNVKSMNVKSVLTPKTLCLFKYKLMDILSCSHRILR